MKHKGRQGSGPSLRVLRVGESMRHAIAEALMRGDVHDPALAGISVTVSEVRMSPDLRHATAFIMPLAGMNADDVLAALNRNAPDMQGAMARAVRMKFTPKLKFMIDESFDEASRINQLLDDPKIRRDIENAKRADQDGDDH
jgi:ribosome-binding factor A